MMADSNIQLTRREQEVLEHLAIGESNKEIARKLDIKVRTVEYHVTRILKKLGMDNRTKIALWYKSNYKDK